ncbi:MAG TPA: restriction endonuclease subunit S [Gammaproteobacteria bacterium]
MVPEGWQPTTFGNVTRIANGQVDPTIEPYQSMPHIGPENVVSNTGQIINIRTTLEDGVTSGKYAFDEHAIVYSKIRPNLNKVCKPGFKGVCSADMYPIWALESTSSDFLAHYMRSHLFLSRAVAVSMRTGMPKINRQDLTVLPIALPPRPEQDRIALMLSIWDKTIAATERLLAVSEKQKKALMQQLLTGRKRLPGFNDEWKPYRLGELFKERAETGFLNLPLLSITSDTGVIPRDGVGRKDTSNADKSKYKRICPGDIGYNTMRMWQGVSALSGHEGIVSPAYTILEPTDKVHPRFAAYLFKLSGLVHQFYRHSQGLVSDTWNLKYHHFAEIVWPFPEKPEQEAIANVLVAADADIAVLKSNLSYLKEEKKALMQQLLTGKRRVKVDAPKKETVNG